jgi:cysteine-rich repeat protein
MAQTPICVPFLTGVTATSVDFYQLNLTCVITASNAFTITGVVHPNTFISALAVNIISYDTTDLTSKSIYFADYSKTTTYLGTQTVFASLPFGYYDSNFIGGLASFSMQINIEFNATLSIPTSNNIYTSSTSLYDCIPQVQIRVRNCPPAYPNYNINDGLCYTICPSTTYLIPSYFLCSPCGSFCATCTSNLVCNVCISPMILQSGSCICPTSSYLYNGICYECDHSCLTCTSTGQFYNCLTCNTSNYRTQVAVPLYNNSCPCISGFYDAGVGICAELCGDSKSIVDECDDGNTISGDGCSSTCKI